MNNSECFDNMDPWGQFIDIDYDSVTCVKNRIKNKVNTPPTIYENDNYYDDLLRVYSSESIPLPPAKQQCIIRNQQNNNICVNRNFTDHPLFVMSYFFYSCVELFWKKK